MVDSILTTFPARFRPLQVQALGNGGGFSGAQLWRVQTDAGELCIRRWPHSHPSAEHLKWVHSVLGLAYRAGCDFVPAPISNTAGETIVVHEGRLWEVTPWMPGEATLRRNFTQEKLANVCHALARFHRSGAQHAETKASMSPGVRRRLELAHRFRMGLDDLRLAVAALPAGNIRNSCVEVVERAGAALKGLPPRIEPMVKCVLAMQPCIRDIWYPHVLYQADKVTGIVDYGAMRIDTVALDLARLLSSVETCDPNIWQLGIDAYSTLSPLSPAEMEIVHVAGRATAVLSGLQWVEWLAAEKRVFQQMGLVESRLSEILEQLPKIGWFS